MAAQGNSRANVTARLAAIVSVFILACVAAEADEQYPNRPVRIVVPFSAGGVNDIVGRQWAERIKPLLGSVFIENLGGAGGTLGVMEVKRSDPDGHTVALGSTSTMVLNTMTNLSGELFKELIGVKDITHVPYKGSAPGVTDLASGHIPMMTPNVGGPLLQFHAAGKVRILAVAANKRLAAAPDIPTAIEAGLPGMVAANFNGLFAPAGVPKDIIKALADETRAAMADPQLQDLMIKSGFEPVLDSGPEPAQREVESEYARWTPIIKKLGFKVQ